VVPAALPKTGKPERLKYRIVRQINIGKNICKKLLTKWNWFCIIVSRREITNKE
jgi:hypothetical protein